MSKSPARDEEILTAELLVQLCDEAERRVEEAIRETQPEERIILLQDARQKLRAALEALGVDVSNIVWLLLACLMCVTLACGGRGHRAAAPTATPTHAWPTATETPCVTQPIVLKDQYGIAHPELGTWRVSYRTFCAPEAP